MSRAKAHIHVSDDPPQTTKGCSVLCGAEIRNPQFVFVIDTRFTGDRPLNRLLVCSACYGKDNKGRYISGVIEAQEGLDAASSD
jgi:hypothetical protein